MSHKKTKRLIKNSKYETNKFKVEAAKEVGIDLENFNEKKTDKNKNEPVDESMYVGIVRSFKKF